MSKFSITEKYAQPEVIAFWKNLSRTGLQKCEQEMIGRYFPAQGRLLDLGCGSGRAVLALTQAGYHVTGIDLSLDMLAAGRSLSDRAQFSGANLLHLPFQAHTFDGLFMFFGALQHIAGRQKRRQALAEMARVTRPDGRLILGLDNVAPALICYGYWLWQKLVRPSNSAVSTTSTDAALWSRQTRRVNPLLWHWRGLRRTLRWRTWPALVDGARFLKPTANGAEPGDIQIAQFGVPPTPGRIYYHLYRVEEIIADAHHAGWNLLGHHSGSELNEGRVYPPTIRRQDKQQFLAFEGGG